jgi:hypothetical protein
MPIPGPGTAISINTIATEFGGTTPHSISEYYRGGGLVPNTPGNAAIPTSGQIALGDFYGSANRVAYTLTISADTQNYDVYTNRGPSYVAGSSDITVQINPGVTVGSSAIPTYALSVPNAFNPGDTITIINDGSIRGAGGTGGSGTPATGTTTAPSGVAGGNAVYVNRPTTITNNGTIAGGGGGGGGGGSAGNAQSGGKNPPYYGGGAGGGGGGGAGNSVGVGGAGGADNDAAPGPTSAGGTGANGTATTGGAGGARGIAGFASPGYAGGLGGAGGAAGAAGAAGGAGLSQASANPYAGGGGGAAGNYITGNPLVTWPVNGTRQGGVA